MNTKIIAYYLPQYYETEENNKWWGEGFTEWTHVRAARPLFKGQQQPRVPLNNNYYNLLDKKTVEWQTKLANEYGVYGFAYYHYWFEGKMLLDRPVKNLLEWKDINQKFFFFWANHTWYKARDGKKKILIEQTDGGMDDWIAHYNYMRDYFLDERYIKVDEKPIVGIYNMSLLKDPDSMIDVWNQLAKKDGFVGVYVIENRVKKGEKKKTSKSDAIVCRQPLVAMNEFNLKPYKRIFRKLKKLVIPIPKEPQKIDYSIISLLERNYVASNKEKEFYGISVGWDNTPRHGNYGQVFTNESPKIFKNTLEELLKKSRNRDFIFINAWNEWAEGMYLEPDEMNGYAYLNAIKEVVEATENGLDTEKNS